MAKGLFSKVHGAIEPACAGCSQPSLKGQAAMEYLVTYGWAILALVAVVGILYSSGAISLDAFSMQECSFQPDLPCSSYILYRDGTATRLQYTITNALGFPIEIDGVTYSAAGFGSPSETTYNGRKPVGIYQQGDEIKFDDTFPSLPEGRDFKTIKVELKFKNCRTVPCTTPNVYTTSGRISLPLEQG